MKDNDNKRFWQRFAKLYTPFMRRSGGKLYDEICGHIRPHLTRRMNVLELACGTGQLSFHLARRVHLWEATDFSEAMITEARKQGGPLPLRFSVQDATNLPYADESFDAVVISNALHIMPHPEKALLEIRRVLKPDGILFAPTFIHSEGTGFRLRVRFMELIGFHAFHKWDEKGFVRYLEDHGFVVIQHQIMGSRLTPLCYLEAKRS